MDNVKSQNPIPAKWYLRPVPIVIAILCVGPFALPLLWISPFFKKIHKVLITLLIIVLTIWTVKASVALYNLLLERLEELKLYVLTPVESFFSLLRS